MEITKIKSAILSCCPEWPINSIRYLGEGDFCVAYLVNDSWIFRFAKHNKACASLKREFCLLPRIACQINLQIPSPQIASFVENAKLSFIAYPFLRGEALSQEDYFNLDDVSRTHCAVQAAEFLNQIHSIEIEVAKSCGVIVNEYSIQYSDLLKQAGKTLFGILDKSECRFIERVINDYLESDDFANFRPVLLHGDLSPGHIIFDEKTKQITSVIDFGDVMIGDAAWDFLWIYEDYGVDFFSRVLSAYRDSEKEALATRISHFSMLSTIEWAVECRIKHKDSFAEAVTKLQVMRHEYIS